MTELDKGTRVAWSLKANGKTVGLSKIHRVYENGSTYCGLDVPIERHRLTSVETMLLGECGKCAAMCARGMAYEAKELGAA